MSPQGSIRLLDLLLLPNPSLSILDNFPSFSTLISISLIFNFLLLLALTLPNVAFHFVLSILARFLTLTTPFLVIGLSSIPKFQPLFQLQQTSFPKVHLNFSSFTSFFFF